MAVSIRWKLLAVAATVTLAYGACGGGGTKDEEASDAGSGGGHQDAASGGGGGNGSGDAGLTLFEPANLEDGIAGKACTDDNECGDSAKGGFCGAGTCSGACESNANCGVGGTCVSPVRNQPGFCSKVCKSNADCASSLECRDGIDFGDIFSDFTNQLADAGIALDQDSGIDVSNLPKTCGMSLGTVQLADGVVGKLCAADTDCGSGECIKSINFLEPLTAGYCSGKCLTDDMCGSGGVCYKDLVSAALKTDGRCLLGCAGTSASGCRAGQVCRTSDFIDAKSYCLPPEAIVDAGSATPSVDAGVHDGG